MTSLVDLALLVNERGDFEVHLSSCRDVPRAARFHPDRTTRHRGGDLVAAMVALDTDAAGWFNQEPYTEASRAAGCWAIRNGLDLAPCVESARKAQSIDFDADGRPTVATDR